MTIKSFFSTEEIIAALYRYSHSIEAMATNTDFTAERNLKIEKMFSMFAQNAVFWDERAQYNIVSIGEVFFNHIASPNHNHVDVNLTFALALRFVLEASLFSDTESARLTLKSIQDFANYNIERFDENSRDQIKYSFFEMPINIVRNFMGNDEVRSYAQFIDALQRAKALQENWIAEMDKNKKRVDELNETLKKQESAFNFVGLYAGFAKLGRIKAKELHWSRRAMFALGALMPAPLFYEVFLSGNSINSDGNIHSLLKILPIASITLILIYYFRVALGNYNSVRAQVMQIELRKSLCRFIQSYADYAKELPTENSALLSKFEDVIFSNIMISEEKTPSTFDGVEQLATLVASIKGGKS